MKKTSNMRKWYGKKDYTKSELRLYKELRETWFKDLPIEEVIDNLKTQYTVYMDGKKLAILDICIPSAKIAVRVNGGVHGVSFAPTWRDELQKDRLEKLGYSVMDIYEDERPDLWE